MAPTSRISFYWIKVIPAPAYLLFGTTDLQDGLHIRFVLGPGHNLAHKRCSVNIYAMNGHDYFAP